MVDGIRTQADRAIGHVDVVEEIGSVAPADAPLSRGSYARVRGWVLGADGIPVDALRLTLGNVTVEAVLGLPRPDLATKYGERARWGGFLAVVPLTAPYGDHRLTCSALAGDRELPMNAGYDVAIGPAADPCAGRRERADDWAFAIDGIFVGDAPADRDPAGAAVVAWDRPARLCLWAIDRRTKSPAQKIFVRSGGVWFNMAKRFARPDAALDVGIPGAADCGFAVRLVPPINTETLELFALSSDGTYAFLGTVAVAAAVPLASSVLPRSGGVLGHLEVVDDSGRMISPQAALTVQRGTLLTFRGWAVDALGPRLAGGVFGEIDDEPPTLPATYRLHRPDVAQALGAPGVADCGFTVTLDTTKLPPGRHQVALNALTARSDAIGLIGDPLTLTIYG